MCGCQDTSGREKRWLEADLSRDTLGLFLSPPPPEVRPFPTAKGEGKRKQAGKLTRSLQHVLCCAWFPPQETQEERDAAPAAPQQHPGTGGKSQASLSPSEGKGTADRSCSARWQQGWEGKDCGQQPPGQGPALSQRHSPAQVPGNL